MAERIIVSLTTWSARIGNIPVVLDTIFKQTVQPDLVVLNVAHDLIIPDGVNQYLKEHHVEVFRCEDSKVYKKLIPTLKRYPNDCVISIDDDWLYPNGMIADFMEVHKKYPNFPISGNRVVSYGMQCHCGCASLTKAEFLGDGLYVIDDKIVRNCPSDDMVYTYFCNRNGHPYIRTRHIYHENMMPYGQSHSYSSTLNENGIDQTMQYLISRFGFDKSSLSNYVDMDFKSIVEELECDRIIMERRNQAMQTEQEIRSSVTYKLGQILLSPIKKIFRE